MIAPLLFATLSAPLSWQQIELNQNLLLQTPIALTEKISFGSGTKMKVTDILPLDEINVISFKMKVSPCTSTLKAENSEMEMVNDQYGAQLDTGCVLNVFLETKDFSQPSLFNAE